MSWHISLLGGLQLFHDNQELKAFQHRKVGVLLAYLAYFSDRRHERDELVRLLWADGPLDAGRNSLNAALSRLRKHLEDPSLLESDRYKVWLATEHVTTDIAQFQATLKRARLLVTDPVRQTQVLREALAFYTGSLLPGFDEPWVVAERQFLADEQVRVLEQLAQLRGDDLAWDEAIEYSRRALLIDPYREQSHQVLLRLYRGAGRPWAAKNHYDDMVTRFRDELNTLPLPETRALVPRMRPMLVLEEPEEPSPAHLPVEISQFFGRETERMELAGLLTEGSRLITLLGTGGVGKTRLALETIRCCEHDKNRIFWASLAEIGPESRLFEVILGVLRRSGVSPMPHPATLGTDPVEEELVAVLSKASSILVLDNLEHLPDTEVHSVIRTLLTRVRRLTILGTSRRRLGITGEQVYHVLPLAIPEKTSSLEVALQTPSVALLQDRIRLLKSGYSLTAEPLEAILSLCARLEGLPLAIEMAAARIAHLPLPAVLEKIEQNLSILVSTNTDVPERHRSLHATLLWSYNLLTPDLQEFLSQLSVFRGGWSLEAAEYVCQRPDAFDALQKLCDASLIQSHQIINYDGKPTVRYRMLESVREISSNNFSENNKGGIVRGYYDWFVGRFRYINNNSGYKFIEIEIENVNILINEYFKYNKSAELCEIIDCMREYWLVNNMSDVGVYWSSVFVRKYRLDIINGGCFDEGKVFGIVIWLIIMNLIVMDDECDLLVASIIDYIAGESTIKRLELDFIRRFNKNNIGNLMYRYVDGYMKLIIGKGPDCYLFSEKNLSGFAIFNVVSACIRIGDYFMAIELIDRCMNFCNISEKDCNFLCLQRIYCCMMLGIDGEFSSGIINSSNFFENGKITRGHLYAEAVFAKYLVVKKEYLRASSVIHAVLLGFVKVPEWGQVGYALELLAEIALGIENPRRGLRLLAACEELRARARWEQTPFEQGRWNDLLVQAEAATGLSVEVDRAVVKQQSLETLLYEAFELPDDSPVLA